MSNYEAIVRGADYDVTADGLLGDFTTLTRGDEVTLSLFLSRRNTTSVTDLETRHERLTNYHEFAGAADTFVDREQVPAYQESIPSQAPVSSLLVGIDPASGLTAPGVWGIVTGGEDQTARLGDAATVDLELFVLADYADFAGRSAVKTEFETPI